MGTLVNTAGSSLNVRQQDPTTQEPPTKEKKVVEKPSQKPTVTVAKKDVYGVELGPVKPESWEAVLDKQWYNNDGKIDELESAMIWASVTMNGLYGSHVRIHEKGAIADSHGSDIPGATHVHIVPAELGPYLEQLASSGARVTREAKMGMCLEFASPSHLRKLLNREPKPNELYAFIGRTLANKHVPVWDYLSVLKTRGGKQGAKEAGWAKIAFLNEAQRIGWNPPPARK